MDTFVKIFIKILHATASDNWPKALHIFLLALAAAILCPMLAVLAGLNGESASPTIVKVILLLAALAPLSWPLYVYRYNRAARGIELSPYWHSIIPVSVFSAVVLGLGIFEATRPLAMLMSLVVNSIAVLAIGAFAFSARLIYAIGVEAPTSASVDVADAEIPAKAVFRVALAILAGEWFLAWYFIAFSAQLTVFTGTLVLCSMVIIVLTSYSLGIKGDVGQKILMYGAATVFTGISLLFVDRLLINKSVIDFLTFGYVGKQFATLGVLGWTVILVLIVAAGRFGTYLAGQDKDGKDRDIICRVSVLIAALLACYLVGSWIMSWPDPILFHVQGAAKTILIPQAGPGSPHADVNIARVWFWLVGFIGEALILFSGMRRQIDPRNRKVFLPRKVRYLAMVSFFLALLVFDWFWWQGGTMFDGCQNIRAIVGFSPRACMIFGH